MIARFAKAAAVLSLLIAVAPAKAADAVVADRPVPAIKRVVIISIDGLRPDIMLRAYTPNLRKLWSTGSFSFWAKTTAASITLPSHVSMLTGVVPETHGIQWNADIVLAKPVFPAVPTVFQYAKKAGLTTAMVAGKGKMSMLNVPGSIDWYSTPEATKTEDSDVIAPAVSILRDHKPDLMFVHLPSCDNVGHAVGWGTEAQLQAAAYADTCVGQIVDVLDEAKLRDSTLIIITADHGGAGRTHGPDDPRSRSIPWIVNGPDVRRNFDLTLLGGDRQIQTFDTFATTCAVLGLNVPAGNGQFIREAFVSQDLMVSSYKPAMSPATRPAVPN